MKTKAQIDHDYWFRKKAKRQIESVPDLEGEVWKPVLNYEGLYVVSNKGRLKSLDRVSLKRGLPYEIPSKLLSTGGGGNYLQVTLFKEGIRHYYLIHRLVCMAFHNNPESKLEVNHIDGNKHNNHDWNLEWCTRSENNKHALDTGLKDMKGGKHFAARRVAMCDNLGNTIEEFDYVGGIKKKYIEFRHSTYIYQVLKGEREIAYNYKWKYL